MFADSVPPELPSGRLDLDLNLISATLTSLSAPGVEQITTRLDAAPRVSIADQGWVALAAMIAEDRPIFIFDDWAARQSAAVSQWFYTQLLFLLKQRGKTLIVATHDVAHFGVADRVLLLEEGTLR